MPEELSSWLVSVYDAAQADCHELACSLRSVLVFHWESFGVFQFIFGRLCEIFQVKQKAAFGPGKSGVTGFSVCELGTLVPNFVPIRPLWACTYV